MSATSAFQPLTLPPQRCGHGAPADLVARRADLASAVAAGYWRTQPPQEHIEIGGVRCLRSSPATGSRGVVLHMHGGAFRIGCPEQLGPFAAAVAARCHVTIISPAYRLAPEHPFPAGLADGWSVLKELAASGETRLIISGDSAGGGLAAGLAALCTQATIKPAGLMLLSPWLDLVVTSASYICNAATDMLFSAESAQVAASLYLQGHSPDDPLASPLRGRVDGFPPTFINVGTGEVLADDARHLHDRLHNAGIAVQLHQVDGMEHVAVTRDRALPGSAEAFDRLAEFVESVLA